MSTDIDAIKVDDPLEEIKKSHYVVVSIFKRGGVTKISHTLSQVKYARGLNKPILVVQEIGLRAPAEIWAAKDVLVRVRRGEIKNKEAWDNKMKPAHRLLEAIRQERVQQGLLSDDTVPPKEFYIG